MNIHINSIPVMETAEWKENYKELSDLYNHLMEKLSKNDAKKVKRLVELTQEQERFFRNSVELNGRMHAIKGV